MRDDPDTRRRSDEDARLPFNLPSAAADFQHWALMSVWTLDEATALTLGRDPAKVNWPTVKQYRHVSVFAVEYERRQELLDRVFEIKTFEDRILPDKLAAWAIRNQVAVPRGLLDALSPRTRGQNAPEEIANLQASIVTRDAEIAALKAQIEGLSANLASGLSTRERNTCLKLIIGMAVNGYGYDPTATRSDKPSEVASDLHKLGLSIDPDTVRKWLKEGAELMQRSVAD